MKQVTSIIQALFIGGAVASAIFLDNALWAIISILIAAGAGYYAYFYKKENNEIPIWKSLSDNTKGIISMIFSPLVLGLVLLLAEISCAYKMMEYHSPSYSWGIAMLICGIASAVFLYNYNSDKKRKLVNEILKYTGCVITTYCLVLCLVTWNGGHKYNYNKEVNDVQNDSYSNNQNYDNNSNQSYSNSHPNQYSYSETTPKRQTPREIANSPENKEAVKLLSGQYSLTNGPDMILLDIISPTYASYTYQRLGGGMHTESFNYVFITNDGVILLSKDGTKIESKFQFDSNLNVYIDGHLMTKTY
ncbi:MAG: hypothetical protein MJZ23_00550 [Paludibacteraceae bacterium]|nr:hypothetical protein [Paludibacteraceae bacterium]